MFIQSPDNSVWRVILHPVRLWSGNLPSCPYMPTIESTAEFLDTFEIFNHSYFAQECSSSGPADMTTASNLPLWLYLPKGLRLKIWTRHLRQRCFLRVLLGRDANDARLHRETVRVRAAALLAWRAGRVLYACGSVDPTTRRVDAAVGLWLMDAGVGAGGCEGDYEVSGGGCV